MTNSNKRLLVMAGGTGGHVFPALAVAQKLQQQGWEIRWLGTPDRMEADLVPKYDIEIDFIHVKGLRGQGILKLLKAPFQITAAVIQARKHIKAWQPDVVLGMGGYVSGPGGIAAKLLGIPVILHEQNAVAGLTNFWLAKIAKRVMQAFPGAFPNADVVGNPVRQDVVALESPDQRFLNRTGPIRILVMGGSQGARILNNTLPPVLKCLASNASSRSTIDTHDLQTETTVPPTYTVWHQAGKGQQEAVETIYNDNDVTNAKVTEFIDDVAQAYAWADVIVCRSGALTVSEISAAGLGAIFIPFMHKDRQQALNAEHLVECGAALMIEQMDLTTEKLAETLKNLDREQLLNMAQHARQVAITDADERVANAIIELS